MDTGFNVFLTFPEIVLIVIGTFATLLAIGLAIFATVIRLRNR